MRLATTLGVLALAGCGGHALEPKSPPPGADASAGASGSTAGAPGADASAGSTAGAPGANATADASHDAAGSDAAESGIDANDAGSVPSEPYRALAVAAGSLHTCALLDDHRVKCWGYNGYGQLGLGDGIDRVVPEDMSDHLPTVDLGTGRTAKAITAGRYTTCALLDDGSVKCWGWAQLAHGYTTDRLGGDGNIGNDPGETGDALAPLDLGPGRTARLVALGYYDGCVVKDDDSVQCWSSNTPTVEVPAVSGRHVTQLFGAGGVLALLDDGTVTQLFASINQGSSLPSPDPTKGADVRAVAVAGSQLEDCIVWANGDSACNGKSGWWPTPIASDVRAAGVLEYSSNSCGVVVDGHVFCPWAAGEHAPWANGDDGPNGPFVRLGQPAAAITGGSEAHFCAVLLDGQVKCWSSSPSTTGYDRGLGGTIVTATSWPSVDLGTRPAR